MADADEQNPPPFIIYDDDDIADGVVSCCKSLVRKIITQKPIHLNSLQSALLGIWCNPKGLRMEEISVKTFQFFFKEEGDVERILRGSPWMFRNSWLLLKRWDRSITLDKLDFSKTSIRVQLWGLLPHYRTPKMGFKLGACLGKVEEAEVFENRERGTFVKIQVEIDIGKPLMVGILVGNTKDGVSWVDFQYERMPQFCYKSGRVGHDEEFCRSADAAQSTDDNGGKDFGPWMRAVSFGRKVLPVMHNSQGGGKDSQT
ncbi:Zinc knuckle CX2CX4HX4C [Sesbania bispinosa]|nr:Zinc knuckle CX2CX4HX4C [Sesbania bispinosa]